MDKFDKEELIKCDNTLIRFCDKYGPMDGNGNKVRVCNDCIMYRFCDQIDHSEGLDDIYELDQNGKSTHRY